MHIVADPLSAPTWITAIATAFLGAGAIVTAIFAILAFRKQGQEVRDQAELLSIQSDQLKAQQASWFSMCLDPGIPLLPSSRSAGFTPPPTRFWGAIIRNALALPVLNTRVTFYLVSPASAASEDWTPVETGSPPALVRVIPPGDEKFVVIETQYQGGVNPDENSHVVSIEFTDAAGKRWKRDTNGALLDTEPCPEFGKRPDPADQDDHVDRPSSVTAHPSHVAP